jgi:hypothetical protein
MSGHADFFLNLDKKTHIWAFGTDLGWIWPFQIFGYLAVWAKKIVAGTHWVPTCACHISFFSPNAQISKYSARHATLPKIGPLSKDTKQI